MKDTKQLRDWQIFEIIAFEFAAGKSPYFDANTCHRQPMC